MRQAVSGEDGKGPEKTGRPGGLNRPALFASMDSRCLRRWPSVQTHGGLRRLAGLVRPVLAAYGFHGPGLLRRTGCRPPRRKQLMYLSSVPTLPLSPCWTVPPTKGTLPTRCSPLGTPHDGLDHRPHPPELAGKQQPGGLRVVDHHLRQRRRASSPFSQAQQRPAANRRRCHRPPQTASAQPEEARPPGRD